MLNEKPAVSQIGSAGTWCICGFLGREKEYVIPFCDVCQIGSDIILVSFKEKEKEKPDKKC